MKALDHGCRAVLRVYPPAIRQAHGHEMRTTFLESCADASRRGRVAMARTALAELLDLLTSAIRVRAGRPRIPVGHGPSGPSPSPAPKGRWMNTLGSDLRQALRALMARPGTTAVAVGLLALAIAACTTVFTVADAVIFNQVPYRDADRLASIGISRRPGSFPSAYTRPDLIAAWRDAGIFEQVEAHATRGVTLDDGADPKSVPAALVTPGVTGMLGARPLRGRGFLPDDLQHAIPPALISENLWRTHFAGADDIVGRLVSMGGKQVEIVGVMPADFRFPHGRQSVWRPLNLARVEADTPLPTAIVKLRTDMPTQEALRLATEATSRLDPKLIKAPATLALGPPSGGRAFDDYTVNTVRLLFVGVLLVLLVACVNVANLLLARALGRKRERAVRTALGASRARLVQQALLESLFIAGTAAALGLALSLGALSVFDRLLPEFITTRAINLIDFDRRAAALVVALAGVATLASGVLPAWIGTRTNASDALKEGDRGASEGRTARRLSSALIVGEIAVAVALLIGAALMVRSFIALVSADRGMDTRGVVKLQLSMPAYQVADPPRRAALASDLHQRLTALPGVEAVTRTYGLPPTGGMIHFSAVTTDHGRAVEGMELMGFRVTPDFFPLFRMQLVSGRFLQRDDTDGTVVISEGLARRLWPDVPNPVGRTFKIGSGAVRQVAGISREIRTPLFDPRLDSPEYFEPFAGTGTSFVVRFREGARHSDEELKAVVRAVHPRYIVQEIEAVDAAYAEIVERPRAAVITAGAFAGFGMLVCAAGLFSVLSLSVARRRREFGIRLAIGAHPSQLSRLVARQTAITLAAGLAIGSALAFAMTKGLSSVLAGVEVTDPASWISVLALVAIAGTAAAWLPVRDARRTDPLRLLREE